MNVPSRIRTLARAALVVIVGLSMAHDARGAGPAATQPAPDEPKVYLFSSFRGNGEDGLHLAWSPDGMKWSPLHGDRSFLRPEVGNEKLMRDPCILIGPDGTYHMVWTDSWTDRGIGYAHSGDLVHWSRQQPR